MFNPKAWLQLARIQMPYYMTRQNADGVIATYSMNALLLVLTSLVVVLNVCGWGIYGLVELVSKVV